MVELQKLFQEMHQESGTLEWEGTFKDYLEMAIKDPKLTRLSHARIHDMIHWAGIKDGINKTPHYQLFEGQLFGVDRTIQRLVQILHAASYVPEERRRILLLMGPPGSGKSTVVNLLKRGLERYSRSDEGALYAIVGCPMQEEPLHLIPEHRRKELEETYGLYIEGDLCPRCRYNVKHLYDGDIAKVKVKRLTLAESEGVGMGSYVATSPEGQDIARLVGSIDVTSLTEDRLEGAGKGFRLDGELEAANRGVMEFIQIFRSDDKFLTVVLGVTQEQVIKLGSFGSVYADEMIIAHSNESEYNAFTENQQTEALLDRLIMLKVPYNLQPSQEMKIYEKLLASGYSTGVHMSPMVLPLVASMSVISRLEESKLTLGLPRLSLLDKMETYDGKISPPFTKDDVAVLQDASPGEGMFGLSPRYVVNRLADAMAQEQDCLTPLDALQGLIEGLEERAGLAGEERERLPNLLPEVIRGYKKMAVLQVQKAATERFEELAQGQIESYINDAKALFTSQEDGFISRPGANDHLMRRMEGSLNMRDSERAAFRQEVYRTYETLQSRGKTPTYKDLPQLNMAIEKLLLPNPRELVAALNPKQGKPDRLQQRKVIQDQLQSSYGYCEKCAQDLMNFVYRTLQNQDVILVKEGKLVRQ